MTNLCKELMGFCIARGDFVLGGFWLGGFCPGDFVRGDFGSGGFCPRGILSGGILSGGILTGGILSGGILSCHPTQRDQVEYMSRWVPLRWGSRWPCTFHVVCVNFIRVYYPM